MRFFAPALFGQYQSFHLLFESIHLIEREGLYVQETQLLEIRFQSYGTGFFLSLSLAFFPLDRLQLMFGFAFHPGRYKYKDRWEPFWLGAKAQLGAKCGIYENDVFLILE